MARSKSSKHWLKEHEKDPYVLKSRQEGFRSRAVYKLKEIQERDRLIRRDIVVVELGAAPGGWSQYVAKILDNTGRMIALDILPMQPLPGVDFIQGDFREETVVNQLLEVIGQDKYVDLVISDMAPNTSGIRSVDQDKSMYLVELAVEFSRNRLTNGGDFLTKVFHGPGFDNLFRDLKKDFQTVLTRKPDASRTRSVETYLLARGFKGNRGI